MEAKEARKITEESSEDKYHKLYDEVIRKIKLAAEDGRNSIHFKVLTKFKISTRIRDRLIELGYDVTSTVHTDDDVSYLIAW